jgi:hypothetical protein
MFGGLGDGAGGSGGGFSIGSPLPPNPNAPPSPVPPNPFATPSANPLSQLINSVLAWTGNLSYTVSFSQTLGVLALPTPWGPLPVPVGVHAFATVDKKGATVGIGPGVVAASGIAGMTGQPFGQSTGTQVVSQGFYSVGNWGGYIAGNLSLSRSGTSSVEPGMAYGLGSGVSITIENTYHWDYPWGE